MSPFHDYNLITTVRRIKRIIYDENGPVILILLHNVLLDFFVSIGTYKDIEILAWQSVVK